MRIGVIFPQTEIGSDPGIIREYTEAVESLGYDHLLVFDHVLGVDTGNYPAWSGVYRRTCYRKFRIFWRFIRCNCDNDYC